MKFYYQQKKDINYMSTHSENRLLPLRSKRRWERRDKGGNGRIVLFQYFQSQTLYRPILLNLYTACRNTQSDLYFDFKKKIQYKFIVYFYFIFMLTLLS